MLGPQFLPHHKVPTVQPVTCEPHAKTLKRVVNLEDILIPVHCFTNNFSRFQPDHRSLEQELSYALPSTIAHGDENSSKIAPGLLPLLIDHYSTNLEEMLSLASTSDLFHIPWCCGLSVGLGAAPERMEQCINFGRNSWNSHCFL